MEKKAYISFYFLFAFMANYKLWQAMEMMKETTGSQFYLKNSDYQNYFDAFVENKSNYPKDGLVQESAMNQVLPYILFLVSPIFVVLLIAVRKGT